MRREHVLSVVIVVAVANAELRAADPKTAIPTGKWVGLWAEGSQMMSKVTIAIKDGDIDICGLDDRGKGRAIGMACTWHPAAKPGQVDFQLLGKVYRGIYSLDGDTLKICWSTG